MTEGVPPQVTEDLPPQVTEDIPDQVTEDVPHVDEDMTTADVDAANVAVDGAEGSPVDDGQGFSSGPRDPLVLTSFADHVAYSIWTGKVTLLFIFCCVVCDNECLINFYVVLFNLGTT